MKKIAILTCLRACQVCTGASCLQAWNDKSRYFSVYADEEVQLVAFAHCNGCDSDPATDKGMQEKLDRLQKIGVDMVHTGVCTMMGRDNPTQCPKITAILDELHKRGIQTTHGTH